MRKRFLAIIAMIAMTFAFGLGAALAAPPDGKGGGNEQSQADKCAQSGGKAEGCENHPGGGDDDEDEGGTPSCADLPAETPEEIRDFCETLEGGGVPELPEDPTGLCDVLREVAAPLGDACDAVVALLTGDGGGGGEQPSCADLPAETPPEVVAVCEALESGELPEAPGGELPELPDGGELPAPPDGGELPAPPEGGEGLSCDQLGAIDPGLAEGCQEVVDALIGAGLPV